MSTQVYQSKNVTEDILVTVDFLSRLSNGETVTTAASAMSVFAGVDADPGLMIIALPTVVGSTVEQVVTDGLPGVIYMLTISIRTSLNNIYINEIKLAVLPDNAAVPA